MGYGARHGHGAHSEQGGGTAGGGQGGYGLLVAATPPGRHPAVDATEALPSLAAAPPAVLLGTAAGSVVQLADPGDPNAVLSHLRTAAAHDGPLLVYLAGQLMLDSREHLPHLALTRSTPRTVRYTGLPWHWLTAEFGRRPAGLTALIADLVADEAMWRQRTQHPLGAGLLLYGALTAPPGRRGTRAPEYSRALASVLRTSRVRPPLAELHQLTLHNAGFGSGSEERMLFGGPAAVTATVHAAVPAPATGPGPAPVTATGWSAGTAPGPGPAPAPNPAPARPVPTAPPAPPAASPTAPPAVPAPPATPPTTSPPESPAAPAPAGSPKAVPAPAPSPPAPDGAGDATVTSLPAPEGQGAVAQAAPGSAPPPPGLSGPPPSPSSVPPEPGGRGETPADVPPGVHDAIYTAAREGRHGEAATMAAQWETAALRAFGPHSGEAVHWVEVRADLAHQAGEAARACTLWLQAAAVRLQSGQAADTAEVTGAVDRAHHCWHQVTDRAQAYPLGVQLAELRELAPGHRPGAVRDVRDRLAHLADGAAGPGDRAAG